VTGRADTEAATADPALPQRRNGSVVSDVALSAAVTGIALTVSHLIAVSAIRVALMLRAVLTNTIGVAPRLR
jgi:hypothetical protein